MKDPRTSRSTTTLIDKMQAVSTTQITHLGEIPALGTGKICFVSTANELDILRISAISFMAIQPPKKLQEEKFQDLQL